MQRVWRWAPAIALAAGLGIGGGAASLPQAESADNKPAGQAAGQASGKPGAAADLDTFRKTVTPFLAAHCVRCHGPAKQEAELTLHTLGGDIVSGRGLDSWTLVAERLKAGEMPPPGEKQPDPAAIKAVTDWIDRELAKAGKSGVAPVGSLKTGNHIPHELLFDRPPGAPLDSPARLWRLRPDIYTDAARNINKNAKLAQPFSIPAGEGFKDMAGALGIDESTAAQLIRNAETLVGEQLGLAGRKGAKPAKEFAALVDEKNPPTAAQVESAVRREFDLVLHRDPTSEELKALTDLHARSLKTGGSALAARAVLMAVMLSPEAVFRFELGPGRPTPRAGGCSRPGSWRSPWPTP